MTEFLIIFGILVFFLMVFGVAGFAIYTEHRQKMAKIQSQTGQKAEPSILKEFQDLKEQMAEMRDTTTKFDMSFDTALQRLESRIAHLESRTMESESERISIRS